MSGSQKGDDGISSLNSLLRQDDWQIIADDSKKRSSSTLRVKQFGNYMSVSVNTV
jgi:hypothetical protein